MCDPQPQDGKGSPTIARQGFPSPVFLWGLLDFHPPIFLTSSFLFPGSGLSLLVSASLEAVVPDAQGILGLLRVILLSSHLSPGLLPDLSAHQP